jgi:23S rRNA pseudouridine1911/1915/1917 synthase
VNDRVVELNFEDEDPQRLDKFLVAQLPDYSRSRLQDLIKQGLVLVNGVPAKKSGQQLDQESLVVVTIPPRLPAEITAEHVPLDLIFENEDLMVVNKPAGMVVHPSAGHQSGTLVHAALAHAPDMAGVGGVQRPGVVHRLDKDTSGLILLAKNDFAQQWLQDQFRTRQVKKMYQALVDGAPPTSRGRVEVAVGRHPVDRKRMAVVQNNKGRQAISEYSTIRKYNQHTLLDVRPITGRTHQIRLHMAFLGCPILGDRVYGQRHPSLPIGRQFLHAARLSFCLPGEDEPEEFSAPLPAELNEILAFLEEKQNN